MTNPTPFNLEAAKRGEPIMFRDGYTCKFTAHEPDAKPGQRVIAVSKNGEVVTRFENGRKYEKGAVACDLVMAPRTRKVWLKLYRPSCLREA